MKKGLGRGLESLFSIYEEDEQKSQIESNNTVAQPIKVETQVNNNGIIELDMKLIDPNMNQPRKYFEPTALKELAESIKQHGVIQPIIVNQNDNRYVIIAGERRFRASLIAGRKTIPAIIKRYTPLEVKEVSLVENLQREDLNPIEAAKAIKTLMNEFDFTQEEVADRIGKSRPLVTNTLRLLLLPNAVIELIEKNKISAGHGKCLLSVENSDKQIEFANIVFENKLSVRDLEKLIRTNQFNKTLNKETKINQTPELKEFGHSLQRTFGTKVKINGNENKGKIIIDYYNKDDLDRIYNLINKISKFN